MPVVESLHRNSSVHVALPWSLFSINLKTVPTSIVLKENTTSYRTVRPTAVRI